MSDIVLNILEKFKKVDGGPLDPQRSGADGSEDDFIGKHIDNVDDSDDPATTADDPKHPHDAGEKAKLAPRKKHRKGYEPGEDADVYENTEFTYADEIAEAMDLSEEQINEEAEIFSQMIDEAIQEFINEEANEEEKELLESILESEEGMAQLIDYIFEEDEDDDCEECGESPCCCDDKKPKNKKSDGVIDAEPKMKKAEAQTEEIERRSDVKMVKVKTADGKVTYRKQRPEIKIGN